MNAIILALGGVRASIFAGVALILLLAAGVQTWRLGNAQDAYADYRGKVVAATAKAAQAAREAEQRNAEAIVKISEESYADRQKINEDYNSRIKDAIAGRDSELGKLRNLWAQCRSTDLSENTGASAKAEGDEGLRESSAARIVRDAEILQSERNECIKRYQSLNGT